MAAATGIVTADRRIADFLVLAAGWPRAPAFDAFFRVAAVLVVLLRAADFAAVLRAVAIFVFAAVPRALGAVEVARRGVLPAPARVVARLPAAVRAPVFVPAAVFALAMGVVLAVALALAVVLPLAMVLAAGLAAMVLALADGAFRVLAAAGLALFPAFAGRRGFVVAFLGMFVSQVLDDEPAAAALPADLCPGLPSAGRADRPPEFMPSVLSSPI